MNVAKSLNALHERLSKIDNNLIAKCYNNTALSNSNDEAIMDIAQAVSEIDECVIELADIVSSLSNTEQGV